MAVRFRMTEIRRLYPQLKGLDLTWNETGEGLPECGKTQTITLADANLVGRLPCANPECTKGGFELTGSLKDPLDAKAESVQFSLECPGYLGHVRSEEAQRRCANRIDVEVSFAWASRAAEG